MGLLSSLQDVHLGECKQEREEDMTGRWGDASMAWLLVWVSATLLRGVEFGLQPCTGASLSTSAARDKHGSHMFIVTDMRGPACPR